MVEYFGLVTEFGIGVLKICVENDIGVENGMELATLGRSRYQKENDGVKALPNNGAYGASIS